MQSMDIQITDWAIAAGWIEGEGCISITSRMPKHGVNRSYVLTIIVANNDPRICEWFKDRWGGTINKTARKPSASQPHPFYGYRWQLSAARAATLLEATLPYMIVKQDQAQLAIAFQDNMRTKYGVGTRIDHTIIAQREAMYQEIKRLKNVHHNWVF